MKKMNSELNIKCTIWEKETFELIDYEDEDVVVEQEMNQ